MWKINCIFVLENQGDVQKQNKTLNRRFKMEKQIQALAELNEHFNFGIDDIEFYADEVIAENGTIEDVKTTLSNWHSGSYIEKGDKFIGIRQGQAFKGQRRQNYYIVNIDNVNYWYESFN